MESNPYKELKFQPGEYTKENGRGASFRSFSSSMFFQQEKDSECFPEPQKNRPLRNSLEAGTFIFRIRRPKSNASPFPEERDGKGAETVHRFPARGIYFFGSSGVGSKPSTSRGTLPVYSPASNWMPFKASSRDREP